MTYRCKDAAENYKKQLDEKLPSKLGLFCIFCISVALILILANLASKSCYASDYIPQEVTSEVYVQEVKETKQVNQRNYKSTYCQYKDNKNYCNQKPLANTYEYNLKPVTVYTGKTVTVQKHYDVYQPKVIYQKVNSYTTTQTCEYCE